MVYQIHSIKRAYAWGIFSSQVNNFNLSRLSFLSLHQAPGTSCSRGMVQALSASHSTPNRKMASAEFSKTETQTSQTTIIIGGHTVRPSTPLSYALQ